MGKHLHPKTYKRGMETVKGCIDWLMHHKYTVSTVRMHNGLSYTVNGNVVATNAEDFTSYVQELANASS